MDWNDSASCSDSASEDSDDPKSMKKEKLLKKITLLKSNNRDLAKTLEARDLYIAQLSKDIGLFQEKINYITAVNTKVQEAMIIMNSFATYLNDMVGAMSEIRDYARKALGTQEETKEQTLTLRVPGTGLDDVLIDTPHVNLISAAAAAFSSATQSATNRKELMSAIREDATFSESVLSPGVCGNILSNAVLTSKKKIVAQSPVDKVDLPITVDDISPPARCRNSNSRRMSSLISGKVVGNKTPPTDEQSVGVNVLATPKTPILSSSLPKPFKSNIPKPLKTKEAEAEQGGKEPKSVKTSSSKKVCDRSLPEEQPVAKKRVLSGVLEVHQDKPLVESAVPLFNGLPDYEVACKKSKLNSESDDVNNKAASSSGLNGKAVRTSSRRRTFVLHGDGSAKEEDKITHPMEHRNGSADNIKDHRKTFTVQKAKKLSLQTSIEKAKKNASRQSNCESLAESQRTSQDCVIDTLPQEVLNADSPSLDIENRLFNVQESAWPPQLKSSEQACERVGEEVTREENTESTKLSAPPVPLCNMGMTKDVTVHNLEDMELTDVITRPTVIYASAPPEPEVNKEMNSLACLNGGVLEPEVELINAVCSVNPESTHPESATSVEAVKASEMVDNHASVVVHSTTPNKDSKSASGNPEVVIISASCAEPSVAEASASEVAPADAGNRKASSSEEIGTASDGGGGGGSSSAGKVRGTITLIKNAGSVTRSSFSQVIEAIPPGVNDPCCSKSLSPSYQPAFGPRTRKKKLNYRELSTCCSDDTDSDFEPENMKRKLKPNRRSSTAKMKSLKKKGVSSSLLSAKKSSCSRAKQSLGQAKFLSLEFKNQPTTKDKANNPGAVDVYDACNISGADEDCAILEPESIVKKSVLHRRSSSEYVSKKDPRTRGKEVEIVMEGRSVADSNTEDIQIIEELKNPIKKSSKKYPEQISRKTAKSKDSGSAKVAKTLTVEEVLEEDGNSAEADKKGKDGPGSLPHADDGVEKRKNSQLLKSDKHELKVKKKKVRKTRDGEDKSSKPKQADTKKVPQHVSFQRNSAASINADMQPVVHVADLVKSMKQDVSCELHQKDFIVRPGVHGDILRIKDKSSLGNVIEVPLSSIKDGSNIRRSLGVDTETNDNKRDSDKENEGSTSPVAVQKAVCAAESLSANADVPRRRTKPVSYKEPSISRKMRRP